MLIKDDLTDKPTLVGDRVRLEPVTSAHVEAMYLAGADLEVRRFTGTHREFTRADIETWCASRPSATARLDLAIIDRADGGYLGDLAVMDLDQHNASIAFRIAIVGSANRGRGLGAEATRLILDHLFDTVGLHRVDLDVVEFNERAIAAYRKAGFREEGRLREAWYWDGVRYDVLRMGVLATDPR